MAGGVLLIIPARKGSSRIIGKNSVMLHGKPLIVYTILAAKQSRFADRIVISTNDPQTKKIGKEYGIEVLDRPARLATKDSKSIEAVFDVLTRLKEENYVPDIVVLLQPTSPFRTAEDIDTAISILRYTDADSVESVVEIKPNPRWGLELKKNDIKHLFKDDFAKQSQYLETVYAPNGAIFAANIGVIIEKKTFMGARLCPIIMDRRRSIDLDDYADLEDAEIYARQFLVS